MNPNDDDTSAEADQEAYLREREGWRSWEEIESDNAGVPRWGEI